MIDELKNCPFCGGAVELEKATGTFGREYGPREWWGVVCRNTINRGGTCAIEQRPSASKDAAIDRWNLRTPPTADSAADARDAERLRFAMQDIDGFGGVVADKYDFAMQIAYERGNDEPTKADELDGIRELIDTAMQEKADKKGQ